MQRASMAMSRKGDGLKRALFLCSHNHLQSRFCEELFNSFVRDEGLNWQAISRALAPNAARGYLEPMSSDAVKALRAAGAAPVNHRRLPLGVTGFDFDTCQVLIAIGDADVRRRVAADWPQYSARVEFWLIDTPRSSLAQFAQLTCGVRALLDLVSGRQAVRQDVVARMAELPGASAKLGGDPIRGKDHGYANSQQRADGRARESPRTR